MRLSIGKLFVALMVSLAVGFTSNSNVLIIFQNRKAWRYIMNILRPISIVYICAFALTIGSLDTHASTINFSGQLDFIELDRDAGVYSGVPVGTGFSGNIDDVTASGFISDGVTLTTFGCCIAAGGLSISNNDVLSADDVSFLNSIIGFQKYSAGDLVDIVNIEGDTTTSSGGRIEIGLSYILEPNSFTNTDLSNYPFNSSDIELALFFIAEEDASGLDVYSAGGQIIDDDSSPTPDIKANDLDSSITIGTNEILSIKVSLSSGSYSGTSCDWWVAESAPDGWYYYNLSSWVNTGSSPANLFPTHQGALFDLSSYTVLNTSGLSEGTHIFYFAVDTNKNGTLDMDQLYYDSVTVNVATPPIATGLPDLTGLYNDGNGRFFAATDSTIYQFDVNGVLSVFATGIANAESMIVDKNGNLYVSDFQSTVFKVSPAGSVSVFATGLSQPGGLEFDANGLLYVTESGTGEISIISDSGNVTTLITGLSGPDDVKFDSFGNLIVTESDAGQITRIALPSGAKTTIATGFSVPFDLVINPLGMMLVSDFGSGKVSKFSASGIIKTVISGITEVQGLMFDSDGSLYVGSESNGGRIFKFPSLQAIKKELFVSNTGSGDITGLRVDANDVLHFASTNGTVNRVDSAGVVTILATGIPEAESLLFDNTGLLYVSEYRPNGRIVTVDSLGNVTPLATDLNEVGGMVFDDAGLLHFTQATGRISTVTLSGTVTDLVTSGLDEPDDLIFDSAGNLIISNPGTDELLLVTLPSGIIQSIVSGIDTPFDFASGSFGKLIFSSFGDGVIRFRTAQGNVGDLLSGFLSPQGVVFDSRGNLYVGDEDTKTIYRLSTTY